MIQRTHQHVARSVFPRASCVSWLWSPFGPCLHCLIIVAVRFSYRSLHCSWLFITLRVHPVAVVIQVGFRDDTSYLTSHYGRGGPSVSNDVNGPTSTRVSTPRTSQHTRATAIPDESVPSGRRHIGNAGAVEEGAGGEEVQRRAQPPCKTRGTLSEQLASIGKAAEDITA